MLVANSFDLWQKDTFFSAAEEVQRSTDIMESAYRTWVKAQKAGSMPQHLEELGRELQMALGTAKWQLEELARAVHLSHRSHGDHITINRHSQFVSAIEDQITHAEKAFKESFSSEGKKPFRWVNLNEEECDDLALFLSGSSSQMATDEENKTKEDSSKIQMPNQEKRSQEVASSKKDRTATNPRRGIPQEKSTLEIVVIDEDVDGGKNTLVGRMCKEVSAKPSIRNQTVEGRVGGKEGALSHNNAQLRIASWFNKRLKGHRSPRQPQVSPVFMVNHIRFILAFMLTIFLVVPFVVYST